MKIFNPSLKNLKNLEVLNLSDNYFFDEFHAEINLPPFGEMLSNLVNLQKLDLSHNSMGRLDSFISYLTKLQHLEEINLSGNDITFRNEGIIQRIEGDIERLFDNDWFYDHRLFQKLPPKLKVLNLSGNPIRPKTKRKFDFFRTLFKPGNTLEISVKRGTITQVKSDLKEVLNLFISYGELNSKKLKSDYMEFNKGGGMDWDTLDLIPNTLKEQMQLRRELDGDIAKISDRDIRDKLSRIAKRK